MSGFSKNLAIVAARGARQATATATGAAGAPVLGTPPPATNLGAGTGTTGAASPTKRKRKAFTRLMENSGLADALTTKAKQVAPPLGSVATGVTAKAGLY